MQQQLSCTLSLSRSPSPVSLSYFSSLSILLFSWPLSLSLSLLSFSFSFPSLLLLRTQSCNADRARQAKAAGWPTLTRLHPKQGAFLRSPSLTANSLQLEQLEPFQTIATRSPAVHEQHQSRTLEWLCFGPLRAHGLFHALRPTASCQAQLGKMQGPPWISIFKGEVMNLLMNSPCHDT